MLLKLLSKKGRNWDIILYWDIIFLALTSFGSESRPSLAPERAKCNTILHLFGEWLFEAAFIGCELPDSKF